jgi:hypothetical protein
LKYRQVEVHRAPIAGGGDYFDVRVFTEDESVRPAITLANQPPLPVRDFLPTPDTETAAAA